MTVSMLETASVVTSLDARPYVIITLPRDQGSLRYDGDIEILMENGYLTICKYPEGILLKSSADAVVFRAAPGEWLTARRCNV